MYLTLGHDIKMPMNPYWYCAITITINFTSILSSTLLIVSMTFDRFYSIIRPHKAASFNTIKRAKITIVCIVLFSILFNVSHFFTTTNNHWLCLPFGNQVVMAKWYSRFYYWLSFTVQFVIPFISLLSMNSVIIHTLRNRDNPKSTQGKRSGGQDKNESQGQGKNSRMKNSDKQVHAILLLVTFGFMILTTPAYLFFIINLVVNFMASPRIFAGYHLFTNTVQKLHFTNHSINFFLYVISGQKFRIDLKKLFKIKLNDSGKSIGSGRGDKSKGKIPTIEVTSSSRKLDTTGH